MSFREKSAWVMGILMVGTGLLYAWLVAQAPDAPVIAALLPYVLVVVVLSVVVQVILALASPKEAKAPADERERIVIDRAGNWSGMVLALGLFMAGGTFLLYPSGTMLFHHMIGALILAQTAEYALQILLLRRSI